MRTFPVALLLAAGIFVAPPSGSGEAPPPVVTPPVTTPAASETPVLGVVPDSSVFDPAGAGLAIKLVETASTAASIGLKAGDLIIAINGKPVKSIDDLRVVMAGLKYDDAIKVDIVRAKEPRTVAGTLKPKLSVDELFKQLQETRLQLQMLQTALGLTKKEPTLADVLQQLKELEERMPAAIAQFKKQYPNGDFAFAVKIDITSDRTAKNPIEIVPPAKPALPPGPPPPTGAPLPPAGTPPPTGTPPAGTAPKSDAGAPAPKAPPAATPVPKP